MIWYDAYCLHLGRRTLKDAADLDSFGPSNRRGNHGIWSDSGYKRVYCSHHIVTWKLRCWLSCFSRLSFQLLGHVTRCQAAEQFWDCLVSVYGAFSSHTNIDLFIVFKPRRGKPPSMNGWSTELQPPDSTSVGATARERCDLGEDKPSLLSGLSNQGKIMSCRDASNQLTAISRNQALACLKRGWKSIASFGENWSDKTEGYMKSGSSLFVNGIDCCGQTVSAGNRTALINISVG